jgi:hypothetical protein
MPGMLTSAGIHASKGRELLDSLILIIGSNLNLRRSIIPSEKDEPVTLNIPAGFPR